MKNKAQSPLEVLYSAKPFVPDQKTRVLSNRTPPVGQTLDYYLQGIDSVLRLLLRKPVHNRFHRLILGIEILVIGE
jgi:hypothetical protein